MMFPERATLNICAIEDEEYRKTKIDFWDDVYGVDMSSIKKWVIKEPLVDVVEKEAINSHSSTILDIDLK